MEMLATDRADATVRAEVPYLRGDLDKVFVKASTRDPGDQLERRALEIRNGRAATQAPALEREGFQIAVWPSRVASERQAELIDETLKPHQGVTPLQRDYVDETIPLIQSLSGARDVISQDMAGVRFSPRSDRKHWLGPAGWAHVDFEAGEIEQMLRAAMERSGRTFGPYSRYVMYQGWRALSPPPQDYPLALCDGRTVEPGDLVPIDYLQDAGGREGVVRSWGCRYSPRHQWWYFPDMTLDEMIVFKGFDSRRPDSPCTLHVAFDDRAAVQPVPRTSYESRYFALFD
jgi:hypothetical protein